MIELSSSSKPKQIIREYVSPSGVTFAYPAYDGFLTNDDPARLCDADFLAPVLLNVGISITTYTGLRSQRAGLERALARVPAIELADATDEQCGEIAAVFRLLDTNERPRGALLTTLAKILHRKRPVTIPLYDELVRGIYQPSRISPEPSRSWEDFARLFILEVRRDLAADAAAWRNLSLMTPDPGPPISPVRALDIVGWRAARDGLGI